MYGRLNKRLRTESTEGFTLIELLIVIVILGILAAIVVFAIGSTRGDAVSNSCKTNVKQIELSAEAVYTKQGAYPTTGSASAPGDFLSSAGNGGLLKAWPTSNDYTLTWDGKQVVVAASTAVKGGNGVDGCAAK